MAIFNNSDTEKRIALLEVSTKIIGETVKDQIQAFENLHKMAASHTEVFEIIQTRFDTIDKKIAKQKEIIDLLLKENRILKETILGTKKDYTETISSIEKLGEMFEELHKEFLLEKSKRN